MAFHNDLGKEAEDLAVQYLLDKGYKIVKRNFRYQKSEIDIIAETNLYIVIIEVKARSTDFFIEPYEAVTKSKIKHIITATNHYLESINTTKEIRFDIISILKTSNNQFNIQHLENAFESFDAN